MELDWTGSLVLDIIKRIIFQGYPEAQTETAKRCAEAIGLHLKMLIITASDANLSGRHSCAISLFRPMEDALDCYAAVAKIPEAAEKWVKGELRASDAARLWEHKFSESVLPTGEKAADYRKQLRSYFNNFAHCTPYLTDWNLYLDLDPSDKLKILLQPDHEHTIRVKTLPNFEERLLEQNAARIGAFLAAHTLEFASVVEDAYERFLSQNIVLKEELGRSKNDLENTLKKEFGAVYLEDRPPELQKLVIKHPSDPNLVQVIPLSKPGAKNCLVLEKS